MHELEVMITLAGLAVLLIILIVPYLFFSHLGLKSKTRNLEELVKRLQSDLARLAPSSRAKTEPKPAPQTETAQTDAQVASPSPTPSPWPSAPPQSADAAHDHDVQTPAAFVFKPDLIDKLTTWLRENWVLAIAAASLALAGVFMVQYGIENGLLTPFWRVMGALGFGAALIAGGEYIRRKSGDDTYDGDSTGATQSLPSVLSGAGIVVLYVAVVGARAL